VGMGADMNGKLAQRLARMAKKLLFVLATMILVWAFAQTFPFDLAILLAGDTLLYVEVVSAVWIASRIANLKAVAGWAKLVVGQKLRRAGVRRALRTRSRPKPKSPPSGDDGWPRFAVPRLTAPAFLPVRAFA